MFSSPLEQFLLLPLTNTGMGPLDFSLNLALFSIVINFSTILPIAIGGGLLGFAVVPGLWDVSVEGLYLGVAELIIDSVGVVGQKYFPFLFTIYTFILFSNLAGLVPYSLNITSHFIQTAVLSLLVFSGLVFICLRTYGTRAISLLLPSGTSLGLGFILVPLEIISFLFKPLSLAVRLFANMMAGHTLLKVLVGFSWALLVEGTDLFLVGHITPLILLVILYLLELAVAIIQSYVFSVLSTIYLKDAINLH
uniref:ATP synthase subunit a n=1 Tax=Phaeophyceae sp. TaxID=2249243 RepID=A0A8E8PF40_9PHAE|nr:Atp6 [Phaeophyceae sp.]